MEGFLVIAAIVGFIWICSKISQANKEREEREARQRREAEQRRMREALERKQAEERRKHEEYLQRRRADPFFDMMERQKEERAKAEAERKRRAEEEAKRQAEISRRKALADKFKYTTLGGHRAAYCFDYYPKNRYPSVSAQDESNRRTVWNFKDGSYTAGLSRLADFLDGNFTKDEMKNVVVCVIPASTQYKNDLRYKTLCTKIAEKFPVINGYEYISIVSDRSDSRGQKSSDTVWNLSFSSNVRGKTIVLFDDITTRGTSFIQVASKLKQNGAANVIGFFLGKTVGF